TSRSFWRYWVSAIGKFIPKSGAEYRIQGYPGRNWASVGELAERLQMSHHATVALLTRCEELDLVERRKNENDKRKVDVYLTDKGREYLQQLAQQHKTELQSLQNTFQVARITALNENYDADQ
ncbi:MarR family transcriptional regulator, partial [Aeromonas caviae]